MTQHAKERALERYSKEITNLDLQQMINAIQQNNHIPLGCSETNKNMKFCYVTYNHIPYKVLYHNKTKGKNSKIKIITVYPFDPDEYNEILETKKQKRIETYIAFLKSQGYIVYKRKNQL
jgi:hypothetical protein